MLFKQLITERVKAAVVNVSLVFLHSLAHRPASLDVSRNFGAVLRVSGLIYSIRVYTSYLRSFILLYLPRIPIRPNCSAVKTAIGAVGGNHNHTVAFRAGAYSGLQIVTDVHNMDEYGRLSVARFLVCSILCRGSETRTYVVAKIPETQL